MTGYGRIPDQVGLKRSRTRDNLCLPDDNDVVPAWPSPGRVPQPSPRRHLPRVRARRPSESTSFSGRERWQRPYGSGRFRQHRCLDRHVATLLELAEEPELVPIVALNQGKDFRTDRCADKCVHCHLAVWPLDQIDRRRRKGHVSFELL
jgi:hypothetical protein